MFKILSTTYSYFNDLIHLKLIVHPKFSVTQTPDKIWRILNLLLVYALQILSRFKKALNRACMTRSHESDMYKRSGAHYCHTKHKIKVSYCCRF